MMKIKFKKLTTVDFVDHRYQPDVGSKTFNHNEVIEATVQETSNNYANLQFSNGDCALDVPKNTYELL